MVVCEQMTKVVDLLYNIYTTVHSFSIVEIFPYEFLENLSKMDYCLGNKQCVINK